MTDELDPNDRADPTTGLDATTAVPTPTADADPAVPPTAPLTPATQTTSVPPTYEHEVAWASERVPGHAASCQPQAPRRARSRPLGGRARGRRRWSSGRRRRSPRCITGQSSTSTVLGYVPAGHHRLRRGPPRPARRPARRRRRSSCRSSRASPTRPRSTPSSTRSSTSWSRTRPNDEQTYTGGHQAVVRRRARVQRRAAAARGVDVERRPVGPRLVPGARPRCRSRTRRCAQAWFDAAIAKTGAKTHDRDLQRRRP